MSGIKDTIKEALGFGPKLRFGIVALGDISQRACMPAFKHSGNSVITALVTGDPKKAEDLAKEYDVSKEHTYSYEQFGKMLQDKAVDAIYLATPNWRHAEFAVPALEAGVHVLLEKPMEISSEQCAKINEAQRKSSAKLMIAYRLHFEPATVEAIERVRKGEIGEAVHFSSSFVQNLRPSNHRAQNGWKGGPLFDMGTYPLNAVRNLFGDEPIEVYAKGYRHPQAGFPGDLDDTVAVTLTFPGNRVGQFICSYYGNINDEYTIIGTKGSIHVAPAFMYGMSLEFNPYTVGDKKKHETFKSTDHFAGQLNYFSECVLKGNDIEPDGEEGLADVRVLEAAQRSIETGTVQKLAPFNRSKQIQSSQVRKISAHSQPSEDEETNAEPPTKE